MDKYYYTIEVLCSNADELKGAFHEIVQNVRIGLPSNKKDSGSYLFSYDSHKREGTAQMPSVRHFINSTDEELENHELVDQRVRYEVQDGNRVMIIQSNMNFE